MDLEKDQEDEGGREDMHVMIESETVCRFKRNTIDLIALAAGVVYVS